MAYLIHDDCICCGACEAECPMSCISPGEFAYIVDANECTECGACANVCPVDAPRQK